MNNSLRACLALFKREFASIAVFSFATNLLMLAPTLYLLQLYDRVLVSGNVHTLFAVTLITCFLFLVMGFCEWMRSLVAIKAGVRFDQLLSSRIFTLGFSTGLGSSRNLANEAMQDLTYIRQFMTGNGLFAFFDTPWTLLYIAVLFILHPLLGAVATVFCLIQFGLGVWNQLSSEQPLQQAGKATTASQRFLDSKARNVETLHVMGMIPHLFLRWQALQKRWHKLDGDVVGIQARNQMMTKFVRYSMQSLMLAAAALLAIRGHISIGAMIAANVLIARALQPFDVIVGTWKQFIQARQSAGRLNALLGFEFAGKRASEVAEKPASEIEGIKGNVSLKGLTVRLEGSGRTLLRDINLEIAPGQILTIMGPSGSGKTTLARCLAGVCAWQGGVLLIDGIDATGIPRRQWAASLGYLPQDVDLIEGSIAENIARFAMPEPADVIEAARTAGIHESILRLPHGYDTRIDDSATLLSGGQRQQLGLARAIYRKPVLLLLDEPNSHLDEHGEASLLSALAGLKQQGKSIVLISHRASILRITDRLLIMKNGEVEHYGPRDTVMAEMTLARPSPAVRAA
ncbi:Type I secretion system ATP-binding protein PrsD [Methylophilaceae bacterium]|nr:Type I secretion system ATP-binding protein PrsD [Methylophilaceae bacterium]